MIRWAFHFYLLITVLLVLGSVVSYCQRHNEVLEEQILQKPRYFHHPSSNRIPADDSLVDNQMKRSTVILDKLMYALQTQLKPQATSRKVYWRCYFNAVTCFRRK